MITQIQLDEFNDKLVDLASLLDNNHHAENFAPIEVVSKKDIDNDYYLDILKNHYKIILIVSKPEYQEIFRYGNITTPIMNTIKDRINMYMLQRFGIFTIPDIFVRG
jgi:hypothetical protein